MGAKLMKYVIKQNQEYGRYIESIKTISRGEIVSVCELLVLSQVDTVSVNKTELQYYTFSYNETQDCLVLGDGEIFNHSDTPNVSYQIETIDGRSKMVFKALQDIGQFEQLFINYSADVQVNTNNYINNKSLI
jgi:tRNA-specific adenosine deaminase 3